MNRASCFSSCISFVNGILIRTAQSCSSIRKRNREGELLLLRLFFVTAFNHNRLRDIQFTHFVSICERPLFRIGRDRHGKLTASIVRHHNRKCFSSVRISIIRNTGHCTRLCYPIHVGAGHSKFNLTELIEISCTDFQICFTVSNHSVLRHRGGFYTRRLCCIRNGECKCTFDIRSSCSLRNYQHFLYRRIDDDRLHAVCIGKCCFRGIIFHNRTRSNTAVRSRGITINSCFCYLIISSFRKALDQNLLAILQFEGATLRNRTVRCGTICFCNRVIVLLSFQLCRLVRVRIQFERELELLGFRLLLITAFDSHSLGNFKVAKRVFIGNLRVTCRVALNRRILILF